MKSNKVWMHFSKNYSVSFAAGGAIDGLTVEFIVDDDTMFTLETVYYDDDTQKYMLTEKDYVPD